MSPPGWKLTWSDEFDGPNGSLPDPTKWKFVTGGNGWGNQEREYYTSDAANAHVEGGALVITALKGSPVGVTCWYGACQYSSARLQTKDTFTQQYGRFEARIQIPRGQGVWPAFWMLGNDIDTKNWPGCGEIDIMENIGKEPKLVHGSMHGPGYSGAAGPTASYMLPSGAAFADDYHVYRVDWDASGVTFFVDDMQYEKRTPADVPKGDAWVFDHPFFMLLNLAIGGGWPGDPDSSTPFPAKMLVDYVRVYKQG